MQSAEWIEERRRVELEREQQVRDLGDEAESAMVKGELNRAWDLLTQAREEVDRANVDFWEVAGIEELRADVDPANFVHSLNEKGEFAAAEAVWLQIRRKTPIAASEVRDDYLRAIRGQGDELWMAGEYEAALVHYFHEAKSAGADPADPDDLSGIDFRQRARAVRIFREGRPEGLEKGVWELAVKCLKENDPQAFLLLSLA